MATTGPIRAAVLWLIWACPPPASEHARIELTVASATDRSTAFMDQSPPPSGKNPRPIVRAEVGESVKVEYLLTNAYPNAVLKDVVVHFFVAPIGAAGQEEIPVLEEETLIVETAHDLDLRPGGHAGGRATFRLPKPGAYLVRVESRNTASDHEHFAAIDLVAEPDAK